MAVADGANNITARFIYGRGLLATATSDAVYCYHFNANGNTTALTDATQNIVNSYAYDPFGQVLDEQETIPQPFKFVGQFGVMAESYGLYYMRARYYDPGVGRFISEDPIGFAGGDVNLFAYVKDDPVSFIDPWGLFKIKICLDTNTLQLLDDDGKSIFDAHAIHGCPNVTPTPSGSYKLGAWEKDKTSTRWGDDSKRRWSDDPLGRNVFGPYFVPVLGTNGIGIHGHYGLRYTFTLSSLVSSCSHGCIRLSNQDIIELHYLMPKSQGTPVEISIKCE